MTIITRFEALEPFSIHFKYLSIGHRGGKLTRSYNKIRQIEIANSLDGSNTYTGVQQKQREVAKGTKNELNI